MRKWTCLLLALLSRPAFAAGDGIITTVAGASAVDNISATASLLNTPSGIVSDGVGNLYFADANNHRIRRVDAGTQVITTIAGTGVPGYSGDFGPATLARLNYPQEVLYTTVYGYPALLFTDTNNHRVRLINLQNGEIQTIAGNGVGGFSGDTGQAQYASLNGPHGVAVDGSGNLYISDTYNHRIRFVQWSTRNITTVAGTGTGGFSNLTYSARLSLFNTPVGITFRGSFVYVCDQQNNIVRRITASNLAISTVAGTTTYGYSGDGQHPITATFRYPRKLIFDPSGNSYVVDHYNHAIRRMNSAFTSITTVAGTPPSGSYAGDGGPARSAYLNTPQYIALAPDNDLLIGDGGNNCVRRVDSLTQAISTIAGTGIQDNVPGTSAVLRSPKDPVAGPGQSLLFVEPSSYKVRSLDLGTGFLNTFAGTGAQGHTGDGGPAAAATFFGPQALARDGAGNTYVADNYYYYIWYYDPFFCSWFGIYCSDWVVGNSYLRKIDSFGNITTVAGMDAPSYFNYSGDGGPAYSAGLGTIQALAISGSNLFLADNFFRVIRRIDLNSMNIYTYAGSSGTAGYGGDNGLATGATFNNIQGMAVDTAGHLFIADSNNNAIRRIDALSLSVTTVCGQGPSYGGYAGDGGPAASAALFRPTGLYFDAQDNLFIADSGNDRVRRIDKATGIISTVVGSGFRGYAGDGGSALQATLFNPGGVTVANGDYYVADTSNNRLRKVGFAATPAPTPVSPGLGRPVAYPSPASDRICFSYRANSPGKVEIQVYNSAMQPAGIIEDTLSAAGAGKTCTTVKDFATGVYLYRVIVNGEPQAPAKFKVIR